MIALFDIDGVLNNGMIADYNKIGLDIKEMQPFWRGDFKDCLLGKKDTKEVLPRYLKEWNFTGSVDDFLQFWHENESMLDMNVINAIEKLNKKMNVYAATNQDSYRFQYLKNEMKLNELFMHMYSSCDIGLLKPDKEYYEYILNDREVEPSNVMYWDDSMANVESALSIGIKAMHVHDKELLVEQIMAHAS